jgi:ABC-type sugar transport system ATPase subunit
MEEGDAGPGRTIDVVCTLRESLGSEVLLHVAVGDGTFVARVGSESKAREGERIRLVVDTRRLHFFDPETGAAL